MRRFQLDNYKTEIIDLYLNHRISCEKIAKLYGASLSGIYDALRRWEVKTRNLAESHKLFTLNENFFDLIDSEEKAYWLGFIYADGYVTNPHSFGIALAKKDKKHLEKLLKSLGSPHKLYDYRTDGEFGENDYTRLLITNHKIFSSLQEKGVEVKKTFKIQFPKEEILPSNLYRHFIRGYFDGDGSLVLSKNSINFKICGTREFLSKLIEVFNNISSYEFKNILYRKRNYTKNNYYLSFGGKNKVYSVLSYLYENSTIYLDRKMEKYQDLKKLFYS